MEAQLKVNGANSRLNAKLILKNTGSKEIVLEDLNSRYFVVQTMDDKVMAPKSTTGKAAGPVKIKAGETVETPFYLQDNYSFWDRLTKYKISYVSPTLKTDTVQVWF